MQHVAVSRSSTRPFRLTLATFGVFGALFGVWAVVLADLQTTLQISDGQLGLAITIGFVASFPTMIIGGRLADRFGARTLIAGTALMMALAFVGFAVVDSYPLLVVLMLLFYGGSGAYDVGINAAAIGVEQQSERRMMAYFHAAFSGFGAIGAILTGLLLSADVPFRLLYLAVAAGMAGIAIVTWWLGRQSLGRDESLSNEPASFDLFRKPVILLLAGVAALAFLSEGSLETWSAIYLRSTLVLPALIGAAGPAIFHTAMLIGRLGSATVIERFGQRTLMQVAGVAAATGMVLALATTQPAVILAGILIAGLALAGVVPAVFSLAGDIAPTRKGEASSVITTVGYSGFLIGPALIGGLAEGFGLRAALATLIGAGLLIVVLSKMVAAK